MAINKRQPLPRWSWSLRSKLTTYSLLFALIPLALVGVIIFTQAEASLRNTGGSNLRELAEVTGDDIERIIDGSLIDINVLARSPFLTTNTFTSEQKTAYLATVFGEHNDYKAIYVTDAIGQVIASSSQTGGDQSQQEWFLKAKQGQVYVSDLTYLTSVQDMVITISAPITANGEFIGVVAGFIKAQLIFDVLDARHIGNDGEIFLVNQDGRIVGEKERTEVFDDLSGLVPVQKAIQGQTGTEAAIDPRNGINTLYSYAPMHGAEKWFAIAALPLDEVNAPANALAINTLQVAALAAFIVSLIAFFVTRGIAQPIRQLAQAASTIAQGNWHVSVPAVETSDEIGQLASAFSTMTQELQTIYDSLEDRIRERTSELETVAQVSTAAATVLDVDNLLQTVSDLTKTNFNLYHAHIYLLDDARQNLVLAAGAGEPGRIMKEQGRSIALNNEGSLVARAGRTREGVIVNDVTKAPDFLPNQLLPDTRSEMAVPMLVGNRLVGVLDVQSDKINRFTEADIRVKTTLASQIAVAVENARAFTRIEQAKAETERLFNVSVDMIGTANFDGYFVDLNPAWERVLGFTLEELKTRPYIDLIHPDDVVKTNDLVNQQLAAGLPTLQFENRYRAKDGNYHWISWNGVPVLDESKMYFVARDVTQSKAAADEIHNRAVELETVAEVSTAASTILDLDKLLQMVVELTKTNFNLYHAHIYLLDEAGERLVLAAGAGKAGRIMKEQGRSIALNNEGSLVARAGRTRSGAIANDVAKAPDFLPNPLLPDTRSEMAVPMIVGEHLIGVLDVQSNRVDRFTENDVRVKSTLAAQIAVAVENARAFARSEAAHRQALTIANVNEALSRADTELDILRPLFDLAPKEHMTRASLMHILTDGNGEPEAVVIVAGFNQDGSALDLSKFPTTTLTLDRFPFLSTLFVNPGQPLVIRDIQADPRTDKNIREWAIQTRLASSFALPLKTGDTWHGLIALTYAVPQDFAPDLHEILSQVMPTAASVMAARQAYLHEEAARQLAETVAKTNTAMSRASSELELLQPLFSIMPLENMVYATLAYITTDAENNAESIEIVAGLMPDGSPLDLSIFPSTHLPAEQFPFLRVIFDNPNAPTIISDFLTDPRTDENLREFAQQANSAAFVSLPLKTGEIWHGVLSVVYATPTVFSQALHDILQQVMPTAGSVLAARQAYLQEEIARRETERRAIDLQTVADVSTVASTILDVDTLLQLVADLTKENFNLYHAHIYLLDEAGENLVLEAGAGEPGRIMKEQGRKIALNHEGSLVARAARTREGAIANDVSKAEDFLPNPLLPDTRSEMAVPMIAGDHVIGVLDVQSELLNSFDDEDVRVKSTLASQVAIAVENARQYQRQVQTAEQLRDLDRLKSEFLANMSHELRTPLNSIIGYSQVMIDGLDGDLPDEAIEDVEAIHGSGKHLLSMINDILDLAKIEAGRMELDLEKVDLHTVAQEVESITSILLKEVPVQLVADIAPNVPEAWGDLVRLRQILNNLVSNAAKFTKQGEIRIHAEYKESDGLIRVDVSDTGEGISEENLEVVFEQFRQADNSSTRKAAGTGMGLAITRHLVHMHGGTIWVTSRLGEGSTFSFTVPAAIEAVPAK